MKKGRKHSYGPSILKLASQGNFYTSKISDSELGNELSEIRKAHKTRVAREKARVNKLYKSGRL